jgi:hypothetical protein
MNLRITKLRTLKRHIMPRSHSRKKPPEEARRKRRKGSGKGGVGTKRKQSSTSTRTSTIGGWGEERVEDDLGKPLEGKEASCIFPL